MTLKHHKQRPEPYDPTLDEIAEGCRSIQAGWSEETFRQRAGGGTIAEVRKTMGWTPVIYTEADVEESIGCQLHQ